MCENNIKGHELRKMPGAAHRAAGRRKRRRLQLHRNIDEGQRGAAQRLVFAEDQRQFALNAGVRQRERGQRFRLQVLGNMGARDESHPNVGSDETLQQFARVQLHGDDRFQPALMKERLQRVARAAHLGQQQRILHNFRDRRFLLSGQRMMRRRDHNQFIAMDGHYREALVRHRHGNDAEVAGVVDDRFQDLVVLQALDVDRDARILTFELGKYLRQDVQAGAFVGRNHNLAARYAMHFRQRHQHDAALLQRFFGILLEDLARAGHRHLAAAAVQQLGSNLLFQGADLRRDGRLGAEAPLGSSREAAEPCDLQKCLELIEVHGNSN